MGGSFSKSLVSPKQKSSADARDNNKSSVELGDKLLTCIPCTSYLRFL